MKARFKKLHTILCVGFAYDRRMNAVVRIGGTVMIDETPVLLPRY